MTNPGFYIEPIFFSRFGRPRYIYIQFNFNETSTLDTHQKRRENLFIHTVIMSTAHGDKNITSNVTRLGSPAGGEHCFPDPAPLHATFQKSRKVSSNGPRVFF